MSSNQAIEQLSAEIGDQVYIDVAKWHLYLREAKLHTSLAESFMPLCESGKITEAAVLAVLASVMISVGGGKQMLPLTDLIPASGITRLIQVLEEYGRSL